MHPHPPLVMELWMKLLFLKLPLGYTFNSLLNIKWESKYYRYKLTPGRDNNVNIIEAATYHQDLAIGCGQMC